MNILTDILHNTLVERIIWSAIVVVISIIIYALISKLLRAKEKKNSKIFSTKKNKTYLRMLRNIVGAVLGIVTVLTVLQIFGVNVSSMLAGVGIASIVVGFALQDAMKDIIRGLEIISDSYYDIGDVIKYGDNTGEVFSIGLRTTRLQDINSMNIVSIANRNIDQVEIVSQYIYLTVPFSHDIKSSDVATIMAELVDVIKKQDGVLSVENQGLDNITDSTLEYQLAITCDPADKLAVRRAALSAVMATFESHHLHLPYPHLTVTETK